MPQGDSQRLGRMGLQAYAQLLVSVHANPGTAKDLAARFGRDAARMRQTLWRMEQLGVVHTVGWERPSRGPGMLIPVFRGGPGVSVPYPNPLRRRAHGRGRELTDPRPELIAFAGLIKAMMEPVTRRDLRVTTGIAHHRIGPVLRILRAGGLCFTAGWQLSASCPAELVQFGKGRNVPRPARQSATVKGRTYRERRRQIEGQLRILGALRGSPVTAMQVAA